MSSPPAAPVAVTDRRGGLVWLWPFRHSRRTAAEIDALLEAARPWVTPLRYLTLAAVAGVLPLVLGLVLESDLHRLLTAALLFPAFLVLVRDDRQRLACGGMLVALALHSLTAIALASWRPERAALVLSDGAAYWARNYAWIRTGIDPEYEVAHWLPAHVQQLGAMTLYGYTSLGFLPLLRGLYELDLMNYYVGRLLGVSRSPWVALFFGWHLWALLRGIAYTRLAYEVAQIALGRVLGRPLTQPGVRLRRLAIVLALLVGDGLLKYVGLPGVRSVLFSNLR